MLMRAFVGQRYFVATRSVRAMARVQVAFRLRAADASIQATPRRYFASPPALTNLRWARRHSLFHHKRPGTVYHSVAFTASRRNTLGDLTISE